MLLAFNEINIHLHNRRKKTLNLVTFDFFNITIEKKVITF